MFCTSRGQDHERVAAAGGTGGEDIPMASQHFVKGVLHDWAAEPYARVGYTHGRAGTNASADFAAMGAPLGGGRVQFAGEAYLSVGANMSVHAALEQGHFVASQVAATLRAKPEDGNATAVEAVVRSRL